jgi:hypothetical protein
MARSHSVPEVIDIGGIGFHASTQPTDLQKTKEALDISLNQQAKQQIENLFLTQAS